MPFLSLIDFIVKALTSPSREDARRNRRYRSLFDHHQETERPPTIFSNLADTTPGSHHHETRDNSDSFVSLNLTERENNWESDSWKEVREMGGGCVNDDYGAGFGSFGSADCGSSGDTGCSDSGSSSDPTSY